MPTPSECPSFPVEYVLVPGKLRLVRCTPAARFESCRGPLAHFHLCLTTDRIERPEHGRMVVRQRSIIYQMLVFYVTNSFLPQHEGQAADAALKEIRDPLLAE